MNIGNPEFYCSLNWGMRELGTGISYMGTKRELAPNVACVIAEAQPGLLMDAFAGMGAVAEAAGPKRQVWTNDVQHFAHMVTRAMFTASCGPPTAAEFVALAESLFNEQEADCSARLEDVLGLEARALQTNDFSLYCELINRARVLHTDHLTRIANPTTFSSTYAWTYFSLRQSIEIDGARMTIDALLDRRSITGEVWRWAVLALGKAALRVANTPGHFAQYLRPNCRTFARMKRQRRRSVWAEWLIGLSEMTTLGTPEWRALNKATRADSLALLKNSGSIDVKPAVVYCDPPYTDDQYSRFYHVLETLVLFDNPAVTGLGLYRPDRYCTPFSLKNKVLKAFEQLIGSVSAMGADLVLSYPTNGLLYETGQSPIEMIRRSYSRVDLMISVSHTHSTFGASKGVQKAVVEEQVFWARP